ncbi:MAG: MBL fold metallo-hydrolase [Bacteroidota bacterium]
MEIEVFKTSFSFLKNQCYLAYNEGKGVLIDPAWEFHKIDWVIKAHDLELVGVLVTHAHMDHTNLANKFAKKYDCQVYMSDVEIDDSGFRCRNLTAAYDLEMLDFEVFTVMPLLTPGHTKGGMCYLIKNHLFTGDTIFIEGVGTCGSIEKHASALFDSVQKVKAYTDMATRFWPGHSFGKPPGYDLRFLLDHNLYFQLTNRSHFVQFRTRKNRPNPFNFK